MLDRIIPILLLKNGELVKTKKFADPIYIGDILNAVKIYNELQVDEITIFDISAGNSGINTTLLEEIVSECFMPVTYGGGINSIEQIAAVLKVGVEKIAINSAANNIAFLKQAVEHFGSSTISVCVDYKMINNEFIVFSDGGKLSKKMTVFDLISDLQEASVGEIMLQSIDRDGTYSGYDITLLNLLKGQYSNPFVIAGGCKDILDIKMAFDNGAHACAAGSLFVYYTNARGILINYPDPEEMNEIGLKR